MKFGNIALFVSALASVAFGHVVNIPNAAVERGVHQDNSILDARSYDESASALVGRSPTHESAGYTILKQAAGTKTLEKGQQYAILEDGGGWVGHHRVVVGIVAHNTNPAGTTYEFANAKYYHVVVDESDPKACCPKTADWDASKNSGYTHTFLGPVKAGADPQKAGEEYLMKTGKRYNIAAGFCFGGNNCQTYAKGLYAAIKE